MKNKMHFNVHVKSFMLREVQLGGYSSMLGGYSMQACNFSKIYKHAQISCNHQYIQSTLQYADPISFGCICTK